MKFEMGFAVAALVGLFILMTPWPSSFSDKLHTGDFTAANQQLEFVREAQWCSRLAWSDQEFIDSLSTRYERMAAQYNQAAAQFGEELVETSLPTEQISFADALSGIQLSKLNFYVECSKRHGTMF